VSEVISIKRNIHLGLGEAIRRLIRVEMMYQRGMTPNKELLAESDLIVEALNREFQLDLGFDCNQDGIPDTIEIFARTAETSCCRIIENTDKKFKGTSRTERPARRFLSRILGDE
jgi:hypothetical protein